MSDFTTSAATLRAALAAFTSLPIFSPNDERDVTMTNAPNGFVVDEVRVVEEKAIALGPNPTQWRRDIGEHWIYVYVPRGTRVGQAQTYATAIRALFPNTMANGVFITRKILGVGQNVDGTTGKWFCIPITIYWYADRQE